MLDVLSAHPMLEVAIVEINIVQSIGTDLCDAPWVPILVALGVAIAPQYPVAKVKSRQTPQIFAPIKISARSQVAGVNLALAKRLMMKLNEIWFASLHWSRAY